MKELKDKIELKLLPVDFEGTCFSSGQCCAISKAVKRQLKVPFAVEGCCDTDIGEGFDNCETFEHEWYGTDKFEVDKAKAEKVNFRGKEPIRTIVLNRVK